MRWIASWIAALTVLGSAGITSAALERPVYTVGDRWTYVLEGSLNGFPGTNASGGDVVFTLSGLLDVDVTGVSPAAVSVQSRANGYINGTFSLPPEFGGGQATATGTFTSRSSERWETQGYLAVESHANATYLIDIAYFVFTTRLDARIETDATTTVTQAAGFPLDVGDRTTAELTTQLHVNATITAFGNTTTQDNTTTVTSSWSRQVLGLESVTVEAGPFSTYKLNQTLGSFPGLEVGGSISEANETAYFSNDAGMPAKRVAYTNGTPVAEARLKSYHYAHTAPQGLFLSLPFLLAIVAAIAVGILVLIVAFRRRRRDLTASREPLVKAPETHRGVDEGLEDDHAR